MTEYVDIATAIGAIYGALQAIAQAIMLFASKNTIAWKWSKYITAGPQRPAETASE